MEAILLLSNSIDNEWESMVQSMDFVLKWSTFRICDNNVQALGKSNNDYYYFHQSNH